MSAAIQSANANSAIIESVVVHGDLSKLSPRERTQYYVRVCESVGLNPLTKPFEYLRLSGREVLYATRGCTDQLRQIHGVSVRVTSRDKIGDVYVVTATATDKQGRTDESTGAVALGNLKGEALANALMKAETKAKRRVTLSICGLGLLDESELDTIPRDRIAPASTSSAEAVENAVASAPAETKSSLSEIASKAIASLSDVDHDDHLRDWFQLYTPELAKLPRNEARAVWQEVVKRGDYLGLEERDVRAIKDEAAPQ